MSAVTKQEIVDALRTYYRALEDMGFEQAVKKTLADRIEQHGIAPPDGWVLVPKEPTAEMLKAFHWKNVGEGYADMLEAAPEVKP